MPENTEVVATPFDIVPYHLVPSIVQYDSVTCTVRKGTVPYNTLLYHSVSSTVQYDTVPELFLSIADYPSTVQTGQLFPYHELHPYHLYKD